jgi:hypothetical protein
LQGASRAPAPEIPKKSLVDQNQDYRTDNKRNGSENKHNGSGRAAVHAHVSCASFRPEIQPFNFAFPENAS